jgi:hypothetical protein
MSAQNNTSVESFLNVRTNRFDVGKSKFDDIRTLCKEYHQKRLAIRKERKRVTEEEYKLKEKFWELLQKRYNLKDYLKVKPVYKFKNWEIENGEFVQLEIRSSL